MGVIIGTAVDIEIAEAVLAERERCAKIAESLALKYDIPCGCAKSIVDEIRKG